MWRVRAVVRGFVDQGRLRPLVWFLLAAYAIAGAQWALSPEIAPLWIPPVRISDSAAWALLFSLSFLWLGVVIAGLIKCGWPGLLMLIPVKWGLFAFYLFSMIYWMCAVHGDCL